MGSLRESSRHFIDQIRNGKRNLGDLEMSSFDLGEVEDVIDDREKPRRRFVERVDVAFLIVVQTRSHQQVRHAQYAVHRRTDLMAHVGHESRLCPACFFGAQREFDRLVGSFLELTRALFDSLLEDSAVRREFVSVLIHTRDHRMHCHRQLVDVRVAPTGRDRGPEVAAGDRPSGAHEVSDRPRESSNQYEHHACASHEDRYARYRELCEMRGPGGENPALRCEKSELHIAERGRDRGSRRVCGNDPIHPLTIEQTNRRDRIHHLRSVSGSSMANSDRACSERFVDCEPRRSRRIADAAFQDDASVRSENAQIDDLASGEGEVRDRLEFRG